MREFLKPTWGRLLLVAVFFAVAGSAAAQLWHTVPPKPPLYDLLKLVDLSRTWLYLTFPGDILAMFLSAVGLDIRDADLWRLAVAHGVYFYLLASLVATSFSHYKNRFPKWLWIVVLALPLGLHAIGSLTYNLRPGPPFDSDSYGQNFLRELPGWPVGSLFLFLLFSLGLFVHDTIVARRDARSNASQRAGCLALSLPAFGCLGLSLSAAVYPVMIPVVFLLMLSGPQSDDQLIREQLSLQLPGFSETRVLERTGNAGRGGRVLTFETTIDGYPDPVTCQGTIRYLHGDPSIISVTWQQKQCEYQYGLVRVSQYMMYDRAGGRMPTEADSIARILVRWVKQGRISVSDIQHPEMRAIVELLLKSEGMRANR